MAKERAKSRAPYRCSAAQRKLANRELDYYIDALGHDHQYDVMRSVRLLQILALPVRMTVGDALRQLERMLALTRAKNRWGRPWTLRQLERIYYRRIGTWRRGAPAPVTEEELKDYGSCTSRQAPRDSGHGGSRRVDPVPNEE